MIAEVIFQKLFVHIFVFTIGVRCWVTESLSIIVFLLQLLAHCLVHGANLECSVREGLNLINRSYLKLFQELSAARLKLLRESFTFCLKQELILLIIKKE